MADLSAEQISVGQQILAAVRSVAARLHLSDAATRVAELDAIEAGLAESSLRNINYGDRPASMGGQMSSSRGPFQQLATWGPLADRTNIAKSTEMFLTGGQAGQRGLFDIAGWQTMPSWQAVQSVQQSEFSDGSNYRNQYNLASSFVTQYGSGAPTGTPSPGAVAVNASDDTSSQDNTPGWLESLLFGPAATVGAASGVDVGQALAVLALEALIVVSGLGLVVLGAWRMTGPARARATRIVQTIAPAAAAA